LRDPALLTDVYSGYVPLAPSRLLHYMFFESENQPSTDPVVVFFMGGPGG
jgi:carboxypeptidase C (cathepsin A)